MGFTRSKLERDEFCHAKDKITQPLISSIDIKNPSKFYALLMPCLFGKEIYTLHNKKVPNKNLFALERNPKVFRHMKKLKHLEGINLPPKPLSALKGLDHIIAQCKLTNIQFDLVYLDFFSQPSAEHYKLLTKLFKHSMLKTNSKLILTFLKNRCTKLVKTINELLTDDGKTLLPVQKIVKIALDNSAKGMYNIEESEDYSYTSTCKNKSFRALVTEITFKENDT